MKVLHLLTSLGQGGTEGWLLRVIAPLRELGIEMDFVLKAPEYGPREHLAHGLGARTYEVRLRPTHAGYVRQVAKIAREGRYDVVHTHEFVYSGVGVAAGKLARLPTVVTLHHFTFAPQTPQMNKPGIRQVREAYGRLSVGFAVRNSDAVTAFSRAVMERVVPHYREDPRCYFLRLCVDRHPAFGEAERARVRASLGWPASAPIIVHAGRFIEQKNHQGLIRIFRRVLDRRDDARLLLMGQGPLQATILDEARDLVDRGNLKYLGVSDDVAGMFSASNVCLFPSLDEGFGLAALEANACGLPVVGSRVPGLDEAVVDGQTAILHALRDEEGMARSVADLLDDPVRARGLGGEGRRRAEALFSVQASADLLADVYRRVLALRGRVGS